MERGPSHARQMEAWGPGEGEAMRGVIHGPNPPPKNLLTFPLQTTSVYFQEILKLTMHRIEEV